MNLKKLTARLILKIGNFICDCTGWILVLLSILTIASILFLIGAFLLMFVFFHPIISILIACPFGIRYIWLWAEKNK